MPKSTPPPPPVGAPTLSPAVAVSRLRELAARGKALSDRLQIPGDEWDLWSAAVADDAAAAFGRNHPNITQIAEAGPSLMFAGYDEDRYRQRLAQKAGVQAKMIAEYADRLERSTQDQGPPSIAATPLEVLSKIFKRFHRVARQMRDRYGGRPTLDVGDEHDLQDLLHALLLVEFDDVRPEDSAPSSAGSSPRIDFVLSQEKIAIETKMTRPTLGAKEVGDELLADIGRYRTHPDCRHLICFIYDPSGVIGNPKGLVRDLSARSDARLRVSVFIEPQ
jgi:hypothetical protein